MSNLRRYIREILLFEETQTPDMTEYVDNLEDLIIKFLTINYYDIYTSYF